MVSDDRLQKLAKLKMWREGAREHESDEKIEMARELILARALIAALEAHDHAHRYPCGGTEDEKCIAANTLDYAQIQYKDFVRKAGG
jgi:hypothetical protein